MKCPYCKSDKFKEGSDFYLCNNPHCLHIWKKTDIFTVWNASKKELKQLGGIRGKKKKVPGKKK
jgi:hypothetical protein